MAEILKAEWNAGTAMVKMIIIIIKTGMGDLIKSPRIKIFNKREVVKTMDIPKVDQIDDTWDPAIIQKLIKRGFDKLVASKIDTEKNTTPLL